MIIREMLEKQEDNALASYAAKSAESRGRLHREPKHEYRTEFQRDRERIIHTTAFRRLEYKTQVFVNDKGDHYRTRLTHTIEVVQIARGIARALRLNEDLTEAIALAHDLGHTPFGHSGETVLNKLMKDHGGFEHNNQSLKVVESLENRYPDFHGLNLTYELREGILKHETIYDNPLYPAELFPSERGSLECQAVNIADEITYTCHDVDDGLRSGFISFDDLKSIPLWTEIHDIVIKQYPYIANTQKYRHQMVRNMINLMVTDCIKASQNALEKASPGSIDDVRQMPVNLICRGDEALKKESRIKQFLMEKVYRHHKLIKMAARAELIITTLFKNFVNNPEQLPQKFSARLNGDDKYIVVADYVAGMTDRFAAAEYKKIIDPFEPI